MDTPDRFDGTRSQANTFLRQVALYAQGRPHEFRDDQDRIHFALSYMKGGTAGAWADRILEEEANSLLPFFATWTDFAQAFRLSFSDADSGATARMKIATLAQGTHTADEYILEFRELAARTGYNDVAHIDFFQRGLHRALLDKIYALPDMPQLLDQWCMYASRFDQQKRMLDARSKPAQPLPWARTGTVNVRNPPAQNKLSPPTSPAQQDPDAMEVDKRHGATPAHTCFTCGKKGHFARNCPQSPNMRQREVITLDMFTTLVEEVASLRKDLATKKATDSKGATTAQGKEDFPQGQ
jgi:hypothetical protein